MVLLDDVVAVFKSGLDVHLYVVSTARNMCFEVPFLEVMLPKCVHDTAVVFFKLSWHQYVLRLRLLLLPVLLLLRLCRYGRCHRCRGRPVCAAQVDKCLP